MSEEIDGVIGTESKDELVVIIISGKTTKAKADKLKEDLKKAVKDSGLTVKVKKKSK